jgi:hypothetical protein
VPGLESTVHGQNDIYEQAWVLEAGSARAWEKECSERYAGLVRLTEMEKLFEMVTKGEISEFVKVVLECTYGVGWCEEWGVGDE